MPATAPKLNLVSVPRVAVLAIFPPTFEGEDACVRCLTAGGKVDVLCSPVHWRLLLEQAAAAGISIAPLGRQYTARAPKAAAKRAVPVPAPRATPPLVETRGRRRVELDMADPIDRAVLLALEVAWRCGRGRSLRAFATAHGIAPADYADFHRRLMCARSRIYQRARQARQSSPASVMPGVHPGSEPAGAVPGCPAPATGRTRRQETVDSASA